MNKLLEWQLKKAMERASEGDVDQRLLLSMVSETYDRADKDRELNKRAAFLMQEELEALQARLTEESESRFRMIMDIVGDVVVTTDEDGMILRVNRAAQTIFGYDEATFKTLSLFDLLTDNTEDQSPKSPTSKTSSGSRHETLAQRKDGEVFPIEMTIGELFSQAGRTHVCIIRDISARKRTERALRQSEERFRDLAGTFADWFWETGADNRLTYVSSRIEGILGFLPEEVEGLTHFELGLANDPDAAARHTEDLAARRPFRDLVFPVSRHGRSRIIRVAGNPVRSRTGEFLGYRGTARDVTSEIQAEARAKQAEIHLVDAIEAITDGIAIYDKDDRLVIVNRHYRELYSRISDLLVPGTPFLTIATAASERGLYHMGESKEERQAFLEYRIAEHRNPTGKGMIVRLDGGRWVRNREFRLRDGGTVGVRTDITDLKDREAELEALQRRSSLILDSAGEGILGLGGSGTIVFVNKAAAKMLHAAPEVLVGRSIETVIEQPAGDMEADDVRKSVLARMLCESCDGKAMESLVRCFDGTSFPGEYQLAPMEEGGDVTGAVMVFRNISLRKMYEDALTSQQKNLEKLVVERTETLSREVAERRRTEEALRQSEQRMRAVANNLVEGVIVFDDEGEILLANRSAHVLLLGEKAAPLALHGRSLADAMSVIEEGLPKPFRQSPFFRALSEGTPIRNDDAVVATAEGKRLAIGYACAPLEFEAGRKGGVLSFRDIEVLKHAQQEAMQSSRLASVGQLAAGIAHEINTPTQYVGDNLRFMIDAFTAAKTALADYRALLDAARGEERLSEFVERIEKTLSETDLEYLLEEVPAAAEQSMQGVAQVTRIVKSMKEFSHPGSSSKVATDLNRAIESTVTVTRNEWKHVAELELDLDPQLPQVICHPGEVNQAMLNLIVNAAHALADKFKDGTLGKIMVTTRAIDGYVEIRVADNGPGVPDSIRDRVFDPFFTTKDVGKGTGQGLAICRDVVVVKHAGKLLLQDTDGGGATFVIRLPIEPPEGEMLSEEERS